MPDGNRSWLLLMIGGLLIAAALALVGGGGWLIALGGSWYYVAAGLGLLLTGLLLLARRPSALVVYALVVLGTLAWALWEVGFDWWPLAARGGVVFVIGILLLLPWVTRRLTADGIAHERRLVSALRGAELPLVRHNRRSAPTLSPRANGTPTAAPDTVSATRRSTRSRPATSATWRSPGPIGRATCAASPAIRWRPRSRLRP